MKVPPPDGPLTYVPGRIGEGRQPAGGLGGPRDEANEGLVSVVFVATNERACVVAAIESLQASTAMAALDVVLVDNASSDGTAHEVRRRWPDVQVIKQERRRGLTENVNRGILASVSQYVLICNSDILFTAHAIETLSQFMDEHPEAAMAAPRLVGPNGEVWPAARRWYTWPTLLVRRLPFLGNIEFPCVGRHLYRDWDGSTPLAVDWVQCAATMLRRGALAEIGLMDQRFRLYFDDVDLALRAHEAGWAVWIVPDAEIVHYWRRASRRPLSAAWFLHLASLAIFVKKHRGLRPRPAAQAATSRRSRTSLTAGPQTRRSRR